MTWRVPNYDILAQVAAEIMVAAPANLTRKTTEKWVGQILHGCPRAGGVLLSYVELELEENGQHISPEDTEWVKRRTETIVDIECPARPGK